MQLIFTVRFKHFVVFYELMHNKDVFKIIGKIKFIMEDEKYLAVQIE